MTTTLNNALPNDRLFDLLDARTSKEGEVLEVAPTAYAGGPWNPDHQHGGAVSGLMAFAVDRIETPSPMRIARISLDMFRGVPLAPLRVETRIMRGGRRIQSVEANLFDGETLVARAQALRIRRHDALSELEAAGPVDPEIGDPPDVVPEFEMRSGLEIPGFVRACDLVPAMATECGVPATTWARLRCRVMDRADASPTVAMAALVDFASGTGNAMDYTQYTSINPDLSIHVVREPRSDWLAMRGVTLRAPDGIGQSHAIVHDTEGIVARVSASLLLDKR